MKAPNERKRHTIVIEYDMQVAKGPMFAEGRFFQWLETCVDQTEQYGFKIHSVGRIIPKLMRRRRKYAKSST